MGYKPPRTYKNIRTLEEAAGVVNYHDPRGSVWGVKSFTLRELGFFQRIAQISIAYTKYTKSEKMKRHIWIEFLRHCVVSHDLYPGLIITLRRKIGWSDYSRRTIKLLTSKSGDMPKIVDMIVKVNLEFDSLDKFIEQMEKEEKKEKHPDAPDKSSDWGEISSSYFIHNSIMPEDFFNLTVMQLSAISETSKAEADKMERDKRKNEFKNKMGGR